MCRTQYKRFCQPCYFIKCADVCQYENGIPYDFPFDLSAVFIAAAGHDVDDANCDVFTKSPGILSVCAFRFCIAGKASRILVIRRTAQNDKRAETRHYNGAPRRRPLRSHCIFIFQSERYDRCLPSDLEEYADAITQRGRTF